MERKKIPVGHEDLKQIIDKNLYFVDKSLMIKELLDNKGQVTLLTRPRRFGKTLNLSMIRRFFEDEYTEKGQKIENGYIFERLMISKCGDEYVRHQQQYPVINLSLKSAKQPDFEMAYARLVAEIAWEFERHSYILTDDRWSEADQELFRSIIDRRAGKSAYVGALKFLSHCLERYHKKKVIILIDEYDVPLENAYFMRYYEEMAAFIRSLFELALKTNPALEFAVVTGCLRISKESIFTGLNNLEIHSVLSHQYAQSFGFTETEVAKMLDYYGLSDKYEVLKSWYDGYRFGGQEIYNPWSIMNYVKAVEFETDAFPKPYWSNTSSNSIIRELIETADEEVRKEIEYLMDGRTIEKPIHEDITYEDIYTSPDNLWNFLYFTGYLRENGRRQEGRYTYISFGIPNEEIAYIYENCIREWFCRKMKSTNKTPLICALEAGDCEAAGAFISEQLLDTISYFDYKEQYYHGFLSGLLSGMPGYQIQSNRESGAGRPDLVLKEKKFMGRAIILELKTTECFDKMQEKCMEALAQIENQMYEADLAADGYQPILKYGLCFFKKGCMVYDGQ